MNGKDFEFEVLLISKSVGLPLECFDFVVEAFEWSGGNRVTEPGEDAPAVCGQCVSERLQHSNPAGVGTGDPASEKPAGHTTIPWTTTDAGLLSDSTRSPACR